MRRDSWIGPLALALLGACAEPTDATQEQKQASALEIVAAHQVWTWAEVTSGVTRATVRNASDGTVHSVLGDGFNSAPEHAQLYLARNGGGGVEWRDATGIWREAGLNVLIEGARSVALRAGASYALSAWLVGDRRPGTYRIRLDYTDASGARASDYSATFEIR
jgi:hypothetical protein